MAGARTRYFAAVAIVAIAGLGGGGSAAGDNTLSPNSQAIKDVPLGDGGYELTTTAGADDVITFTKGQQLIQVHVSHGVPGAAMTLAQKVASKL